MKSAPFFVLFIACFILIVWGQASSTASVEDVRAVVALAEQSPAAQKQVADALAKNPTPSNYELIEVKSEVNNTLVRELSSKTGKNSTLETTKSVSSAQAVKATDSDINTTALDHIMFYMAIILVVMMAIKVGLHMLNTRNSPGSRR